VRQAARAEGLNDAAFIRRCINGALLEVSDDSVLLRERGLPIRWHPTDLIKLRQYRASGLTISQIAARMGHSRSAIFRALKRDQS
jgi:hypothetical protein